MENIKMSPTKMNSRTTHKVNPNNSVNSKSRANLKSRVNPKRKVKKRRPKYGCIFFSLLLLGIMIYFLVQLGIDLFYKEHSSYLATYGELDLKENYQAIVIRNEMVVQTNTSGQVKIIAQEGRVVSKGEKVVEIFNDGNAVIFTDEETQSNQIQQQKLEYDYNVLEFEIMNLKDQIMFHLNLKDYKEIPALKRNLLLKLEMREKLEGENKFLANRTSSYTQKTVGNGSLKEGQSLIVNAPASGILTYELDGYEDVFTIDNIYNINYDEIDKVDFMSLKTVGETIKPEDPIFKIIDHATGYLVVLIDNNEVETYKNVNKVSVKILDEVIEGHVYDVFVNQDKAVAVIRIYEAFEQYFDQRKISCEITRQNYKGLKLYVDSIITVNNQSGVYVVNKDRSLKFVPIKIIGYDADFAIVFNEQFYNAQQGIVRSVKANQEIVREATKYKEGDFIR